MRYITDLTPQNHYGIGGTDLGIPFRLPNGEFAWVLGDTFERNGVGGPGWRSPVLMRSPAPVGSEKVPVTSVAGGRYAKQIFNYAHQQGNPDGISTVIPSDGLSIGSRAYLGGIVMRREFGNVWWSELQASDDNGENWFHTGAKFTDPFMAQHGFDLDPDTGLVHAFTTTFDRKQDVRYYIVPAERFTDPAAWVRQPFAGIGARVGEFNLRKIGDRWYMGYFDAGRYRLALRWAATPAELAQGDVGGYTDMTTVQGVGWGQNDPSRARMAQIYAGYVFGMPGDIGIVASHWNTEAGWPYRSVQFHVDEIAGGAWDDVMTELRGTD